MDTDTLLMLKNEFKLRVLDESFVRIRKCLDALSDEQIRMTPNENIPSVSNQVRHICGNMRQWVLSALGNESDRRNRSSEFLPDPAYGRSELKNLLNALESDLRLFLDRLNEEDLEKNYTIQIFEVSGFSALVHVIEHCSYHTGQITLLTKLFTNRSMDYYDNKQL